MKKSTIIIIIMATIFTFFLAYKYYFESKIVKNNDAIRFKKEYEKLNNKKNKNNGKTYMEISVNSKNVVKYSSYDEIFEILKTGTGVIYFGFPECPWCRNLVPVLLEASEEIELDTIYYLNIKDDRNELALNEKNEIITEKEGNKNYFKLVKALDSILGDYVLTSNEGVEVNAGEKRIYLPTLVFVMDGKIVGHHFDTVSSQTDPYIPLDDRQQEELLMELVKLSGMVTGSVCDESC